MNRKVINPWKWQDQYGFVQANDLSGQKEVLVCSGQTPNDEDGSPMHRGDMAAQINLAFENVETVLREAGWRISDIVQIKYYTTDVDRFLSESEDLRMKLKFEGCEPASTLLGVTRLAFPGLMVEIEALAMR